jgi:hypothetical protein
LLNSQIQKIFGNLLNFVNVRLFSSTLNSLPLATLAMIDKFLSGYKEKDRDNEDGASKGK